MVSNAARYAVVANKLKEYVAVHFRDQATVAARAMEDLKAPFFTETERPVRMFWADKAQTAKTKNKRNSGTKEDNNPKVKDCEHKLVVDKYLESYTTNKEGTEVWTETKGKFY